MYSIIATFVLTAGADVPDCNRAERVAARHAKAGCVGTTQSAGCQGTTYQIVELKKSGGCAGSYAAPAYRTPLRTFFGPKHPVETTTYHAPAAKMIVVPTPTQTAPPPAAVPQATATPKPRLYKRVCDGVRCWLVPIN